MKRECIEELIRGRREIEFVYNKSRYSITYYKDNREKYISFCKFYQEPIDVATVNQLLSIKIGSYTLELIFSKLPDSSFLIY